MNCHVVIIGDVLIQGMLTAAVRYRQSAASVYQVLNAANMNTPEFVPWTACAVIRSVIRKQVNFAFFVH